MAGKEKGISAAGLTGGVLLAVALGIGFGLMMINPNFTPVQDVTVDPKDQAYDPDWGKIPKVPKAKVTHILISAKDAKSPAGGLKDKNRTLEQARKLAEEIWAQYKDTPAKDRDAKWKELQKKYNEDNAPHTEYDVDPNAGLIQEFKDIGLTTDVGFARITMPPGMFGYHIIRREK